MQISYDLKQPIQVNRRHLLSNDKTKYLAEFFSVSNSAGQIGFAEIVQSKKLAQELAAWHLSLQERRKTLELFHDQIPIAAMLESIDLSKARFLVDFGFKTLKFKVGRSLEKESEALFRLREQIGFDIDIRLDANRALTLKQANEFGKKIAALKIAYFEEPLQDILEIPDFFNTTGIPVALDETLVEGPAPILQGVTTYALKPFLMPDLESIFNSMSLAKERKLHLVIASAFESPASLPWLIILAAMNESSLSAAGLSTFHWFEGQELRTQFSVEEAIQILNPRIMRA